MSDPTERLAEALTELKKNEGVGPVETQQAVHKAMRETQLEYLHHVSPAAAQAYERGQAGGATPLTKAESDLDRKAQAIRKVDPRLTKFEAMRLAMADDRDAQARYLEQTR